MGSANQIPSEDDVDIGDDYDNEDVDNDDFDDDQITISDHNGSGCVIKVVQSVL